MPTPRAGCNRWANKSAALILNKMLTSGSLLLILCATYRRIKWKHLFKQTLHEHYMSSSGIILCSE
uniref:Uncharacterized protein n=1 Tax=Arion vulgaris TaxID=1028688 RepID=A0A0B6ZTJ3_9EUPU